MIYELLITDTYYVMQYSTQTCTHEVLKKEAFTLEGTEYKNAVRFLDCLIGHGVTKDNTAKTGTRITVINKITGKIVFQSDNYVYGDGVTDEERIKEGVLLFIKDNISKTRNYTKMVGWGIATLVMFYLIFSFKTCKDNLDREIERERTIKEVDRETARSLGIDKRGIERTLNGENIKEEDANLSDSALVWSNCGGDKKKCRELFKKIYMSSPDPYHNKNGKTRSIAGPGVSNYTEFEFKGDTIIMYSFRYKDVSNFEWDLITLQWRFKDCGIVYIKAHSHEKKYYGDTSGGLRARYNPRVNRYYIAHKLTASESHLTDNATNVIIAKQVGEPESAKPKNGYFTEWMKVPVNHEEWERWNTHN